MSEVIVGVRELKARLSDYLRKVRMGDTIVITDHGEPVAHLVPAGQPLEQKLQAMVDAGSLAWSGQGLAPAPPLAAVRGTRCVADLLIEERG